VGGELFYGIKGILQGRVIAVSCFLFFFYLWYFKQIIKQLINWTNNFQQIEKVNLTITVFFLSQHELTIDFFPFFFYF